MVEYQEGKITLKKENVDLSQKKIDQVYPWYSNYR